LVLGHDIKYEEKKLWHINKVLIPFKILEISFKIKSDTCVLIEAVSLS
jgi:hypothetical protein